MRLGFFTTAGFSAPLRAAVLIWIACFSQALLAQVSDGEGLTPLEGVQPVTDDRALWDGVKDSRDVNDFKAYLNKFPNGLFADVAANRVRALGGASPPALAQSEPGQPAPRAGQTIKDCADCPEMVVLPAGSFQMGSNENADEQPVHRVNVPSFLIGKTEVTQGQWKAVIGSNPSFFNTCGDDCPVDQVSWNDAQEFAQRLSQKTGKQYRLPSEAEWEYAARAGSTTRWSFGDSESQLDDHAWYRDNSLSWFGRFNIHRVAQKRSNAFGLHDMHGNVWEWVEDCWHDNYSGAPADGSAWTSSCNNNRRVNRGGSWGRPSADLRSAGRSLRGPPHMRGNVDYGLRLARTLFTP